MISSTILQGNAIVKNFYLNARKFKTINTSNRYQYGELHESLVFKGIRKVKW